MKTINTVTGTITADKLGTTLMHEHLMVGGADGNWTARRRASSARRPSSSRPTG